MRWARAGNDGTWRKVWASERGTVTAEFAIVLPAVLVVLGLVVGGILLAAHRITLVSLSGEISRAEARGDRDAADAILGHLHEGIAVDREQSGRLHCVTLTSHPIRGLLSTIAVTGRTCAVDIGVSG